MDFPLARGAPCEPPPGLIEAIGARPIETFRARDLMAVFPDEDAVLRTAPDFRKLAGVETRGLIVTAPGREADFVSRFFAPRVGIDEDPVTGSAHCTLAPYWAERSGKRTLHALQLSARGGELWCELRGGRVILAGHATPFRERTVEV
jgi:predicted PhzF superfamily epimerase YddE/YHI9